MSAPDSIYQLVEKFDRDKPGSEDEVQQYFVDPLFEALGWNMRDKRQVRHEPSVIVREAGLERSKRADYSFHIGNTRHFFVETKMPHINLERNPIPAFQLRRYGWSGNTAVSVLTDFEEFSVYDCRIQPQRSDPAATARLRYYEYGDYIDHWDELKSRFSREAVADGALREWIEGERVRGVFSVDQAFLREMENWRELLAQEIALHNRDLTQRQLNLLVQRTIDRIVFLRIAEDRDIEAYGRLRSAAGPGKQVYEGLKTLFNEADDKYNSGLFHFSDETRASQPDRLSLNIHIPDDPLRHIIKNLYFPFSPYEFSVLPADILGQVYEQFLGKVIELNPGGAVRVEEKPEVRKAGGVYYTPAYIVDYIVENTVGVLLDGKTPDQAAKLRILDPACGSGSFLTGAYQYLLDWHLNYYREHPAQYRNRRRETADGMILTTAEKRRILLNNIYGVDLDQNAVEVSKLSLLLKMLENENEAAGRQTIMFSAGGRILPDLSGNIKWGNSLIGSDFFRGPQATLFGDEEEMQRIKAFDWDSESGFGAIMAAGGFDAVIGNPPYIPIESMDDEQRKYYQRKFPHLERKYDSSVIFILAGLSKLSSKGLLGFISSITWQTGTNYSKLRKYLVSSAGIRKLVNLPFNVFKDAYVDNGVYVLSRNIRSDYLIYQFPKKAKEPSMSDITYRHVGMHLIDEPDYKIVLEPEAVELLNNIVKRICIQRLGDFTISTQGLSGSRFTRVLDIDDSDSYQFLEKGQVYRYDFQIAETSVVTLKDKQSLKVFYEPQPKILFRRLVNRQDRLMAGFTTRAMVFKKDVNPFIVTAGNWNTKYVLGILNSRLLSYLYIKTSSIATKNDFRQTTLTELRQLPIRTIDFDNPADKAMHDKMIELVNEMLDRQKQLPGLTGEGRKIAERLIETVDDEIDALVYRLYGLSADEVRVVEGADRH